MRGVYLLPAACMMALACSPPEEPESEEDGNVQQEFVIDVNDWEPGEEIDFDR